MKDSIPDVLFAPQHLSDQKASLYMFAGAFYDASEKYFESIGEGLKRKGRYAEERIFPALYLFRHAVELYLKAMVLYCLALKQGKLDYQSQPIKELFSEHRPSELFKQLEKTWPTLGESPLSEQAKEVLNQLIIVDNHSQAFRYPFDKNFAPFLSSALEANSKDLWNKLKLLGVELSGQLEGLVNWYDEGIANRDSYC